MGKSYNLTQTAIAETFATASLKNGSHGLIDRKYSPINHGPLLSTASITSFAENLVRKKSFPKSTQSSLPLGFHSYMSLFCMKLKPIFLPYNLTISAFTFGPLMQIFVSFISLTTASPSRRPATSSSKSASSSI